MCFPGGPVLSARAGYRGVWGRSPQRGPGAEPPWGVRGAPPENFAKIEVF